MVMTIVYLKLWISNVGDSALQLTFGNLWRYSWGITIGVSQAMVEVGDVAKHQCPGQSNTSKNTLFKMSIIPRLRNPSKSLHKANFSEILLLFKSQ